MGLVVALLCVLSQAPSAATNPPKPNFAALVLRQPKTPLTTPLAKAEWGPSVAEATALAKYLDRAWDQLVDGTASERLTSDSLLVVRQFDDALGNLDRSPTLTEALARVRAYYAVLDVISQIVERAEAKGFQPPVSREQLKQLREVISQRYRPLFSRVV